MTASFMDPDHLHSLCREDDPAPPLLAVEVDENFGHGLAVMVARRAHIASSVDTARVVPCLGLARHRESPYRNLLLVHGTKVTYDAALAHGH